MNFKRRKGLPFECVRLFFFLWRKTPKDDPDSCGVIKDGPSTDRWAPLCVVDFESILGWDSEVSRI